MPRGSRKQKRQRIAEAAKEKIESQCEDTASSSKKEVDVSVWNIANDDVSQSSIPKPLWREEGSDDNEKNSSDYKLNSMKTDLKSQLTRHWKDSPPTVMQQHVWGCMMRLKKRCWQRRNLNINLLAPTASGKTAAYSVPLLLTSFSSTDQHESSIILVPTRELVIQVHRSLLDLSKVLCLRENSVKESCLAMHGGVSKSEQRSSWIEANRTGSWIIVATTGRLLDLLQEEDGVDSHTLLNTVTTVVLDEGDRMGLSKDLCLQTNDILKQVRNATETLRIVVCSATKPSKVNDMLESWLQPSCIQIQIDTISLEGSKPQTSDETVHDGTRRLLLSKIPTNLTQTLHVCSEHKKSKKILTTLAQIAKITADRRNKARCLIFCAQIKTVQYVANLIVQQQPTKTKASSPVIGVLHSQLAQHVREQVMVDFRAGKVTTLVATDVAARGIHIADVSFVVNYDFPGNLEQYVHRCGRAGRNAQNDEGVIFSFFTRNLAPLAGDMIALLESGKQHVDPNLRAIAAEKKGQSATSKKRRDNDDDDNSSNIQPKPTASVTETVTKSRDGTASNSGEYKAPSAANDAYNYSYNSGDEVGYDDGEFTASFGLTGLKRATNVSDASSDSDDDD